MFHAFLLLACDPPRPVVAGPMDCEVVPWHADADGDGHGSGVETWACEAPSGLIRSDDDCDDTDPAVHPGTPEACDGRDEDCDGQVDLPATDAMPVWYADLDADGAGGPTSGSVHACASPAGFAASADDCDDADATTSPHAVERCDDGVDNTCDLWVDCDDPACARAPACEPVVTSITPDNGLSTRETPVVVHGSGFVNRRVPDVSVTIGAAPCTDLVVVDDETITCTVSDGGDGPAHVYVSTATGWAALTDGFWFHGEAYVATADTLYGVVPHTGDVYEIGPLAVEVAALAYAGALYGVTTDAHLVRINRHTAAVTDLGPLEGAPRITSLAMARIYDEYDCHLRDVLLGWSPDDSAVVRIDTWDISGVLDVVPFASVSVVDAQIAFRWPFDVDVVSQDGAWWSLDVYERAPAADPRASAPDGAIAALTYSSGGIGYVIDADGTSATLSQVGGDGSLTPVVALPPGASALASE